ncbi:MAG: glycosyltransferase family 4 protein [Chlorobi bacterium]|nr:glycosyltransferase family 4 protein [Chlorobiota bacterium]
MKKILFLSLNYPPMMTCGASRAFRIASMLPEAGWLPLVAAPADVKRSGVDDASVSQQFAHPVYRAGEAVDADALGDERVEQLLQGMSVTPPAGLAMRMISGLLSGGVNLSERWEKHAPGLVAEILGGNEPVDAIYAQGPGPAPLLLALELAGKHHLPVLFDIVAPLESIDSGGKSDAARLEERILTSGHHLTTPTRALKEYFLKKYFGKVTHDDITIIPDFCIPPDGRQIAGNRLSAGQSPLVVLLEDVSSNELKVFMSALGRFMNRAGILQPSVSFIGGDRKALEKYARKYLPSISAVFVPRLSDREELGHIGRCSMFGVVLGQSERHALTVPERLVDAACMGKPVFVIGPDNPAARLSAECGGVAAPLQEADFVAGALNSLWEQVQERPPGTTAMHLSERFPPSRSMGDLTKLLAYMLPI